MTRKWLEVHQHDYGRIFGSMVLCYIFSKILLSPGDGWIPYTFANLLFELGDIQLQKRITGDNFFDFTAGSWGIALWVFLSSDLWVGVIVFLAFLTATLWLWKYRAPRLSKAGEILEDSVEIKSW